MRSLIAAWRFLTIIPVPFRKQTKEEDLYNAPLYFPLTGALLGLILLAFTLLFRSFLPTLVSSTLVVIIWAVITGAMHLDGLADTFDGLAGKNVAERLEIMRDSHHGSFGVISIVCIIILKIFTLSEINNSWLTGALLLAPALGRWAMAISMTSFPYARPSGLGSVFQKKQNKLIVLLAGGLQILALSFLLPVWRGLVLGVIISLVALGIAVFFKGRFGGLTGDNYGAINEICESLVLLGVILICNIPWMGT